MNLGQSTTSTVVVIALGVALLALGAALGAHLRLAGIQRRYRILWAGGQRDLVAVLSEQAAEITRLRGDVVRVAGQLSATVSDIEQSLRHVAVVRYDAFGDLGGRLSFSAAVVDDRGDGLVISSIHARGGSRTYAKGVLRGNSAVTLTPEEQQALAAARTGKSTQ